MDTSIPVVLNAIPQDVMRIAITIAPKATHADPLRQLQYHLPILKELKKCCKIFYLNAELTLNGVLHYHGVLQISDKVKWYKSVLPKIKNQLGFVLIKPNPNDKWDDYCFKDNSLMEQILETKMPLNADHELIRTISRFKKRVPDKIQSPKKGKIFEQMYNSESE